MIRKMHGMAPTGQLRAEGEGPSRKGQGQAARKEPPMSIRITGEAMTSDTTPHSARAEGNGWTVTWLPGPGTDPQQGHHGHGAGRDGRRRRR